MKNLFFGLLILAAGCASVPGEVSLKTSSYDGTKQLVMRPGWASSGLTTASMKLGAWKTSGLDKDAAVLVVETDSIKPFSSVRPNFLIKIDGIETALSPTGSGTSIEIGSDPNVAHTSQEYRVELALIQKMVESKDVMLKLLLVDNGYMEGRLDKTGPTAARSGFEDFLKKAAVEFK